jgi:hypothetical protein
LAHTLSSKRVLEPLAANIQNPRLGGEAYRYAVKNGLAFPSRDAAEVSVGALRFETAIATGTWV